MTILTGHVRSAVNEAPFRHKRDLARRAVHVAAVTGTAALGTVAVAGVLGVGATVVFGATGAAFAVAIAASTAIWLIGAIGTTRTIRRQAPLSAAADRAAVAELRVLLDREA